jgi:uncharacterized membrane protein YgaE (UPF0421/DUF939 family)
MTFVQGLAVGIGMGLAQGTVIFFMVALAESYKIKRNREAVDASSKKFAENVEKFRQAFAEELAAAPTQRPPMDLS